MKCVIIFAGLLAFALAIPLKPCVKVPVEEETLAPVEAEFTTELSIGERFGDESSATTLADEQIAPTTYAPLIDTVAPTVVVEELPATTAVPVVEDRISETVAPTESADELIATTLAPVSETVAPTVVVEELTIAPETTVLVVVNETPDPAVRTPDVSEEPSAVPETPAPTVVEPSKEEELAKPEEPKKVSRLITFTFYDRSSKATSLKHFLEYLISLKK